MLRRSQLRRRAAAGERRGETAVVARDGRTRGSTLVRLMRMCSSGVSSETSLLQRASSSAEPYLEREQDDQQQEEKQERRPSLLSSSLPFSSSEMEDKPDVATHENDINDDEDDGEDDGEKKVVRADSKVINVKGEEILTEEKWIKSFEEGTIQLGSPSQKKRREQDEELLRLTWIRDRLRELRYSCALDESLTKVGVFLPEVYASEVFVSFIHDIVLKPSRLFAGNNSYLANIIRGCQIVYELHAFDVLVFSEINEKLEHRMVLLAIARENKIKDRNVARGAACGVLSSFNDLTITNRDKFLSRSLLEPGCLGLVFNPVNNAESALRDVVLPCASFVRLLCGCKPSAPFERLKSCIGPLSTSLSNLTRDDGHREGPVHVRILSEVLWALSDLTDGENDRIEAVTQHPEVVVRCTALLSHNNSSIVRAAQRIVGNIVTGDDSQTQTVVDAGAVSRVKELVHYGRQDIEKEALWMLSNVAAGTVEQIAVVIEEGCLPVFVGVLLEDYDVNLKREATWCVSNITSGGSSEQLREVANENGLLALFASLSMDTSIQIVAMEGMHNLFRWSRNEDEEMHEKFITDLVENGGLEMLEAFANGEAEFALTSVYAQGILRESFRYEGEGWPAEQELMMATNPSEHKFHSFKEAVKFWTDLSRKQAVVEKEVKIDSETGSQLLVPVQGENENELADEETEEVEVDYIDLERIVPGYNARGVLMFLSKLRGAKEFQRTQAMRVGLAKRVIEALELIRDDEYTRDEIISRMVDSVDACSDKPIQALNQIGLVAKVAAARGDPERLRRIGRGVMNLDIVHGHVRKKIQSLGNNVDDVCVFLRFEIDLREDLDLPITAQDMIFPNYVRVTEEEINSAREDALSVPAEVFEAWLEDWPEWQREKRRQFADGLKWEDLDQEQLSRQSLRLSLTNMFGEPLADPVRILDDKSRGKRPVWSFADLMKHWVPTGLDLHNNSRSVDEMRDNLRRCITRKSLKRLSMSTRTDAVSSQQETS